MITHAKYETFKHELIVLLLYQSLQTFIASATLLKNLRIAIDCLWQQTLHSDERVYPEEHALVIIKYIRLNANSK